MFSEGRQDENNVLCTRNWNIVKDATMLNKRSHTKGLRGKLTGNSTELKKSLEIKNEKVKAICHKDPRKHEKHNT